MIFEFIALLLPQKAIAQRLAVYCLKHQEQTDEDISEITVGDFIDMLWENKIGNRRRTE